MPQAATSVEVRADSRETPYRLRRIGWTVSKQVRHQTCGRAARGDAVFIDVATTGDGTRRAAARGLVTCSSIWGCAVCSRHIRAERGRDLEEMVELHRADGGGLAFVTLTIRHARDFALADLLDTLQAAWKSIQQSRGWRARRDSLGWIGFVRALEITHGLNGFHPHLHVLLFTGKPLSHDQRDDLYGWLEAAWIAQLQKRGHTARPGYAVDVRRVTDDPQSWERIAGYSVKAESMKWEIARTEAKRGRSGSRTMWQVLDAAGDGETWAVMAWQEYEHATRGRRAIEPSRGLRTALGLGAERPDDEVTDDAAADGIDVVEVETVAVLSALEWRAVASAGWDYRLLRAYVTNDDDHPMELVRVAVERWLARRRGGG